MYENLLTQCRRTAAWLAALPLARLGTAGDPGTTAERAYELVCAVDRLTRLLATGSGPPAGIMPPRLAPQAAGWQLAVFTDELARQLTSPAAAVPTTDQSALAAEAERLTAFALDLRRGALH